MSAVMGAGRTRVALAVVCAVLFITFLDTTIVSVALADVQSTLHAGVTQLQWVVNGYALPFASLMLVAGSLSDRWGRRRLMRAGLTVFGLGSLLGALAPNVDVLITARVLMGVGAAASEPGTLSVIRHLFPEDEDRARALGAWTAVSGLALALGPVIGGALVGAGSWRDVFWMNVGVSATVLVATVAVPESSDPSPARLDLPGFVLGAAGIGALAFAVILGETDGYGSSVVVSLFVLGGVALVGFVAEERRSRDPMLDLRYLASVPFRAAMIVGFVVFFGIFSIFFFTALYLAAVVGYSPDRIALEFVPMAAAMILGAGIAGRAVALVGPRLPMAEGCFAAAAGILCSALLLDSSHPSGFLALTLALAGVGFGASIVPVTAVALGEVSPERSGMAASATNTSRELGSVFGVAVLGALVNAHLTSDLIGRLRALHIPSSFNGIIINAIETGGVPTNAAGGGSIEGQVIGAAYAAFRDGLEEALVASGIAIFLAGIVAAHALAGRTRRPAADAGVRPG